MAGVFLTGDITEQLFWVLHGQGGNGKNKFIEAIGGILGPYSVQAPESLLTVRKGGAEHSTELAGLAGSRLVVASETDAGAMLRLQLVKKLTGDERFTARRLYSDYCEFDRTFKLILMTNNKPRITEQSEAAWRRIVLIPFDVIIPPEERDAQLGEKLKAEWPGILNWMIAGCLQWQESGLQPPPEIANASSEYRANEDSIGRFISECCETGDRCKVPARILYNEYRHWAESNGEYSTAQKRFNEALLAHGFDEIRSNSGMMWIGIAVKPHSHQFSN
jgi:putative DNA primase/helicase